MNDNPKTLEHYYTNPETTEHEFNKTHKMGYEAEHEL